MRRAVTNTTALVGLRVRLERMVDPPCVTCGETVAVIGEGADRQTASLRCAGCDCHRGCLPQSIMEFLSEVVRLFGVLDEPLVIKDASHPNLNGDDMPKRSDFFPSRFVRAADLQGRTMTAVIEDVALEDVGGDDGKQKPVIRFRGKVKGLVLNATNYDLIADCYGDETRNWPGQPIELYPTKVPFKGQLTDAIRVRPKHPPAAKPQPKSEPAPDEDPDDDIEF